MELGETLTITAVVTSTTYLATRSKNNSEVTIRISPTGGSPATIKRITPKTPPLSLATTQFKPSNMPAKLELDPQLPASHDRSMMQGWAMVATQPQTSWDIAWVCTASFPVPKISIMLESELSVKPCVPSQFEEIESIEELEAMPIGNGMDKTEPLKFEIKTKTAKTYRIITNNFMTNGLRRLITALNPKLTPRQTDLPSPSSNPLDSTNPRALPRVNTPKPPLSTVDNTPPQLSLEDSPHATKSMLGRTNTSPAPHSLPPHIASLVPHRSASFDVIPQPVANVKPAPRPISLNVYDLIKKNLDTPKRNDPRSFLKMHSVRSKVARKLSPRTVSFVPAVSHLANKMHIIEKRDDESDFSDCDDGASNFSEDMEDNSLRESTKNIRRDTPKDTEINVLSCSDAEIRDLCERTKGLSPDINFVLQTYSEVDSDASSCFSEDYDSEQEDLPRSPRVDDISDSFSEGSALSSSVSSSGIFDAIAVGRSDPGIRRLHKNTLKKSQSEMVEKRKIDKAERKRREKEAKVAARMSKRIDKIEKKHKEEEKKDDKHKEEKKDDKQKDEKHKDDKSKEEKHKSLNIRVKSWLKILRFGSSTSIECS